MSVLPPIQARYGPTLPDLLARRLGGVERARRVVAATVVLLALLVGVVVVLRADDGVQTIVHSSSGTFNFRYDAPLKRLTPRPGEIVRFEARRGDLFLSAFLVRPLRLAPYRGDSAGTLPLAALAEERSLARRFTGFTVVGEGRQRVNEVAGYQILFDARLGARRLFGRVVLLPQDKPGARTGLVLEMLSTPAGGAGLAASVGNAGALVLPFRSLRFGTEGP